MKPFSLRPARLFLVVALGVSLAGCNSGYKPGGVTVTVVDVRAAEATALETSATVTLRFTNENVIPLGFDGGVFKLYLNGSYVGKAVSNQPIGLAPMNTATQDVIFRLENFALVRPLLVARDRQVVSYKLETVLKQTINEDKLDLKTSSAGSIDLAAVAGPR